MALNSFGLLKPPESHPPTPRLGCDVHRWREVEVEVEVEDGFEEDGGAGFPFLRCR